MSTSKRALCMSSESELRNMKVGRSEMPPKPMAKRRKAKTRRDKNSMISVIVSITKLYSSLICLIIGYFILFANSASTPKMFLKKLAPKNVTMTSSLESNEFPLILPLNSICICIKFSSYLSSRQFKFVVSVYSSLYSLTQTY